MIVITNRERSVYDISHALSVVILKNFARNVIYALFICATNDNARTMLHLYESGMKQVIYRLNGGGFCDAGQRFLWPARMCRLIETF